MSTPTRCGMVSIVGKPNVGKSTFLNALLDQKLSIVSPKPQATRLPVVGILTTESTQIAFADHPGLMDPKDALHHAMRATALATLQVCHAILYLHPVTDRGWVPLADLDPALAAMMVPVAVVLTMSDKRHQIGPGAVSEPFFLVSAREKLGLEAVLQWCRQQLPSQPFRYEPDQLSPQPVRFFVAEYVREAAFELLREELPYAVAVQVDEFREGSDPLYIRVTIFVERSSQKGVVLGQGGRTIRALGELARKKIEILLDRRIYLDTWVKVLPKWRKREQALARLGFQVEGRPS